jgi:predicted nucleic acid-binding protein
MTTFYLDTSALGKRYVQEIGTAWIRSIVTSTPSHTLLIAWITMVEIYSALARRRREGSVTAADYSIAVQAFTAHCASEYDFVELEMSVVILARDLLERHPLRAYDAIQLASALVANKVLLSAQLPPLTFLSADERLNTVAVAEGLIVDNPNLRP